jgi:hypothetical protein
MIFWFPVQKCGQHHICDELEYGGLLWHEAADSGKKNKRSLHSLR